MKPKKILVVDHDKAILKSMALIFKEEGIQIKGVRRPTQALWWIKREHFDLVITAMCFPIPKSWGEFTDFDLGKTIGVELAKRIRAIRHGLPIMAFTFVENPDFLKKLKQAGVKKIIRKPGYLEEIVDTAKKLLYESS